MVHSRLMGKVCIIAGTGGSMGRAAAVKFAAEGAHVIGCDIDPDSAGETCDMVIAAGGTMASLHPLDLSIEQSAQRLVDFALQSFGHVDVLYNNAPMFAWLPTMTRDRWASTVRNEPFSPAWSSCATALPESAAMRLPSRLSVSRPTAARRCAAVQDSRRSPTQSCPMFEVGVPHAK